MPSSPLFTGDYEMQTDFTNDVSRQNQTMRGAAPLSKRRRIRNDQIDRETDTCLVACAGPNAKCSIF